MRLVINKKFNLYCLSEEDYKHLYNCTIWYENVDDHVVTILEQKIDLYENDMETFLDIVEDCSEFNVNLHRYSSGRYELEVPVVE